jgi:CxxC motif-containing protein
VEKIIKKCKVCPIGCQLIITENPLDPSGYTVEGNSCNRGKDFAIDEITKPSRVVTGKVILRNGPMGHLPVKTTGVIPKNKVEECLKIINSTEVSAPVNKGDVIIKNILGLGVDVVAQRKVKRIRDDEEQEHKSGT